LRDAFTGAGWLDLDNARAEMQVGPDALPLEFVGVDDPHIERDDYASVSAPPPPTPP
jgi:hypothetical protein